MELHKNNSCVPFATSIVLVTQITLQKQKGRRLNQVIENAITTSRTKASGSQQMLHLSQEDRIVGVQMQGLRLFLLQGSSSSRGS